MLLICHFLFNVLMFFFLIKTRLLTFFILGVNVSYNYGKAWR